MLPGNRLTLMAELNVIFRALGLDGQRMIDTILNLLYGCRHRRITMTCAGIAYAGAA